MATVYKALTRPTLLRGVPIAPFMLSVIAIAIIGLIVTKWLWLLIPALYFLMRRITSRDEHVFSLMWVWWKTLGKKGMVLSRNVATRFYKARAVSHTRYDNIDIKEFLANMKLNQRQPVEEFIPYSTHIHPFICKTKRVDYVASWELQGEAFQCQTAEALELLSEQFNKALVSFSGETVTFYVHTIREKYFDRFNSVSGNKFADKVMERYYNDMGQTPFYRNRIFFTVCYIPFNREEKLERKAKGRAYQQKSQDEAIVRMNEIRETVEGMLRHYRPVPLGLIEEGKKVYSSLLSFFNYLISGQWQKIRVGNIPFYNVLGSADLYFSSDSGQANQFDRKRFFRCIEIKNLPGNVDVGGLDALLFEQAEYVTTQSFTCMSKTEALETIKSKGKALNSAQDDAVSEQVDLDVLRDMITSGDVSVGKWHYSFVLYADSLDQLVRDSNDIRATLTDLGMIVTLAQIALPAAFFAQLPGNYNMRPRCVPISSQNFADMTAFHSVYGGKRDRLPWGEAMLMLDTESRDAYYLNLHQSLLEDDDFNRQRLGNAKIIGTAGAGKTMLLDMLAYAMQKYRNHATFSPAAKSKRLTTVFFDKDRGAEVAIRALGGEYYRIRAGEPSGWNPFALESTRRNRKFVKDLMKLIVTRRGQPLSDRQEDDLFQAVDDVMDMPLTQRQYGITQLLSYLNEPTTVEAQENGLRIRLKQWKQGGEFGWVFDNEADTFDVRNVDNFGIDGTEFLDDADTRAAISFYLLYRVTSLLDGRRLVIIMDEFWKWLTSDAFTDFAYNMLKVIRKLNGVVIFATQSLDEVVKNKIARAAMEVTETSIWMANPDADYDDYVEKAKVDPAHFNIIKTLDPGSRQFLVVKSALRRGEVKKFAALVKFDLSAMGDYLKILSAGEPNLEIFDEIWRPGMKPEDWIDRYLERAL